MVDDDKRLRRREAIRTGMEAARAAGRPPGRPRKLVGAALADVVAVMTTKPDSRRWDLIGGAMLGWRHALSVQYGVSERTITRAIARAKGRIRP
ncbi:hypothetical protein [Azospirillum sp. TSO22-1]|uniref:hypothetical protein n=1 Tax=Azospirillum sp. TSO22-1 TaxID=716789 RepID=UPI0011B70978|nr:hypothetical protein [Azospirillum sp. TSO22-1]